MTFSPKLGDHLYVCVLLKDDKTVVEKLHGFTHSSEKKESWFMAVM